MGPRGIPTVTYEKKEQLLGNPKAVLFLLIITFNREARKKLSYYGKYSLLDRSIFS